LEELPPCAGYVVASLTTSHLDAVEALLPRGAPIYVEKPLSNDVLRAKRLPAPARDLVFIMHKWRYHPGVLELSRIVRDGDYGPPLGFRSYRLGWGNPHVDVSSLWILMPHDVSIVLQVLGETPQITSAARDPMGVGADSAIVHLKAMGVPATIEVSSGHPIPKRRILLHCHKAVCVLDSDNYQQLTIRRFDEPEARTLSVSDEMPLLAELKAFVSYLQGGPRPMTSLEDELDIITVIAAVEAAIA
jgi:predicted dehydrogenase